MLNFYMKRKYFTLPSFQLKTFNVSKKNHVWCLLLVLNNVFNTFDH